MRLGAVRLDDQALSRPEEVGDVGAHRRVHQWRLELVGLAQLEEAPLEGVSREL